MPTQRRGWNKGSQCLPADQYDIRVERGLLKRASATWPAYGIVTTPSAYRAARPHLSRQPAGVVYAEWLDSTHQQELSDQLPDNIQLAVGLGGGTAVDASKFCALDHDAELILAPTILSSGAIIHGHVAKRDGYQTVGGADDWPWVDPEYVLVDVNVVLQAPYYLHTAGLGDILCGYAGLAEWRHRWSQGRGPEVEEGAIARAVAHHEYIATTFEATLDDQRQLTEASVVTIMQHIQERDSKHVKGGGAGSGDHPFWQALETINRRTWIHGELVALVALIITWACRDDTTGFVNRLDRCRVRRRPSEIGLEREQLRKGLEYSPEFMEARGVDSVLRHEPVVAERFDEVWDFLEA